MITVDTSRIDSIPLGQRVHVMVQFREPAYKLKPDRPGYSLGELTLEVDCEGQRAHNIDATILDSLRRPGHHETYPQALWRTFRDNELGEAFFERLCPVIGDYRIRRAV